ncbi:MAG: hypothetical protein WC223_10310 [Bacteroidales bacterium]|jgi:hypothetical protein
MKYLLYIFFILLLSSCYRDNEEELYLKKTLSGNNSCDTVNVNYSQTISVILANSCTGCHSPTAAGGYDLRTLSVVQQNIDRIIGSISHQAGFIPMPDNGLKLDDCKIKQFNVWKQKGFPQ